MFDYGVINNVDDVLFSAINRQRQRTVRYIPFCGYLWLIAVISIGPRPFVRPSDMYL